MNRRYDASRRQKAAERTRLRIVEAALKLHWEGITEYGPLAKEAGCSLATVRKHFPTKESLFQDCTQTFGERLVLPDLEALGRLASPPERLERCVSELCRVHESMLGYAWLSAHARSESPTLDSVMTAYEGLADAMTGILSGRRKASAPVVRGLLDFLTYRALRLSGGLSPEQTELNLTATLRPLVLDTSSTTDETPGDLP